ncbi:MAG TPA: 16S rRNA (guanine(527)-N(7))-methyltransferase RsmG [Azospira sp.]|nr:16S rRNA (guanine(527)-N(7))-methyltransferase RsmG [Azospira sp.]HNN46240.1 16S rRNA (guanine(527)-N(7))-methyltransferase RsmG [Azospira sp.]
MTREQQLAEGMKALGLDLPADVQERLLAYAAFLEKWNRTYSLTALRDPKLAVSHHLLDSLAIMPYVSASTLLDVGSGGGQPGIPLAIARPDLAVTLLDSNGKKTAFLQQAVIELGLKNVQVVTVRVEEFKPAAPFVAITSRAFAELADFVGLTRHLLAPGGEWLAMKGQRPVEEMNKLPAGVSVTAVHRLLVPGVDGERHLVVMRES